MKFRIPIRYLTVFGVTALVAFAVGIVFFLGFISATKNTRLLMSDQANVMINSMEQNIALWLRPVHEQAKWVDEHIVNNERDARNLEHFDQFMLGALAATDQVAGIAFVTPDGLVRRWVRTDGSGITEDWSTRKDIIEWIESGSQPREASWIEPLFTDTIGKTILLHEKPIHSAQGNLLGMLAQIVPIEELSRYIASLAPRAGMTPFILYGEDRVLAHPSLIDESSGENTLSAPLATLQDFDDDILLRIWSPDEEELYFLTDNNQLTTSGTYIENRKRFYVYIYRYIKEYGNQPWIIGAHLDTEIYGGAESKRLMRALLGSFFVLLVATAGAIFLGRYITRPVTAFAEATRLVEENKLDAVPALSSSRMLEFDDASRSFNQMILDLRERTLMRQTLGQFVPEEVARTLLSEGGSIQTETAQATVLYSDIEGFTQLTETLGSTKIVEILNAYFSAMVEILEQHGGVVTQFHGDAILATFNVPIVNRAHANNALLAASEMLSAVEAQVFSGHGLRIRIGIDSGPVVAGAVGAAGRLSYTVYGNAVNQAARLEVLNKEFGTYLLVSEHTAELAGDAIPLQGVGTTDIRGQSEAITAYTLRVPQ